METPERNHPYFHTAAARARQVEEDVRQRFAVLQAAADERDEGGKLTAKAKQVRQSLKNPDLSTTTVKTALAARLATRSRLIDDAHQAALVSIRAMAEHEAAVAALAYFDLKQETFEEAAAGTTPRRRNLSADEISPEEMAFLRAMRERGVPPSAMDQGNAYDRDFLSLFLKDLSRPIDRRHPLGAWCRTFSQGTLDLQVSTMTDDEIEAIRIIWSRAHDEALEAKRALEQAAGRPLDISLNFALMLTFVHDEYDLAEVPGVQKTIDTAERLAWERDVATMMKGAGLDASDLARAREILRGPAKFGAVAVSPEAEDEGTAEPSGASEPVHAPALSSSAPSPQPRDAGASLASPVVPTAAGSPPQPSEAASPETASTPNATPARATAPTSAPAPTSTGVPTSTAEREPAFSAPKPSPTAGQSGVDRYRAVATEIVTAKLNDFWKVINLPNRTKSFHQLEFATASALAKGIEHEYLAWMADQATRHADLKFMDEFAEREIFALSEKLASDVLLRHNMRQDGFPVP